MSVIKDRLIKKINMIKGFESEGSEKLTPQASRKIIDIPRWFLGNACCFHTMTECVKKNRIILYDDGLQEFFIEELDYPKDT